jgi:hypothetical protein
MNHLTLILMLGIRGGWITALTRTMTLRVINPDQQDPIVAAWSRRIHRVDGSYAMFNCWTSLVSQAIRLRWVIAMADPDPLQHLQVSLNQYRLLPDTMASPHKACETEWIYIQICIN